MAEKTADRPFKQFPQLRQLGYMLTPLSNKALVNGIAYSAHRHNRAMKTKVFSIE